MSNLFLTLVIAFVVIVFAIALLAIGWFISGKRLEKGCGRDPSKKQDSECGSCELCDPTVHSHEKSIEIEDEVVEDKKID